VFAKSLHSIDSIDAVYPRYRIGIYPTSSICWKRRPLYRLLHQTAYFIENPICWDIMPCSPLEVNRRFRGTCHLHLEGRTMNRARNQHGTGSKKSFTRCALDGSGWRSMTVACEHGGPTDSSGFMKGTDFLDSVLEGSVMTLLSN
jgi:hypothetical protein